MLAGDFVQDMPLNIKKYHGNTFGFFQFVSFATSNVAARVLIVFLAGCKGSWDCSYCVKGDCILDTA